VVSPSVLTFVGLCLQGWLMTKNRAEFLFNEEGDDDGHVKLELTMENAGVPHHRTYGAFSASTDECVGSGAPCEVHAQWTEWKQEDDQVYRQYLDEIFKGAVD
jgi:hypothetical protein